MHDRYYDGTLCSETERIVPSTVLLFNSLVASAKDFRFCVELRAGNSRNYTWRARDVQNPLSTFSIATWSCHDFQPSDHGGSIPIATWILVFLESDHDFVYKARFTSVKQAQTQAQATSSHGEICEASASARQWELFHFVRLLLRVLYTCDAGF